MAMTVRALLERPRLQLTLVGGEMGLDGEITWAHASDLPSPWDWMGPGELLLTNGTGIGHAPDAQVRFLERLARIGASGLVIGLGTGGAPLTAELAARSEELELPLLTVPYSVRFSDIIRMVAEGQDAPGGERLSDIAQFYDLLRLSLAAGDLGPGTFEALGRQLGLRLSLVDAATGESVFDQDQPIPLGQALARSVAEHGHAIPGLLRLTGDGTPDGDVCAVAVTVPGEHLTALIVEPLGDSWPSTAVLQHVAVAGAVQLAQIVSQRQRDHRLGGQLLEQLLDPRPARSLATSGIDLGSCVLALLRPAQPTAEDAFHRACSLARIPVLLLRREDLLHAILPESALMGLLPDRLADLGCSAGVSDVIGTADRMRDASSEAAWALSIAERDRAQLVRFGDRHSLLMPRTPAEAQLLVDQILGTVLEYDQVHGTHLTQTIRAIVAAEGSWRQAAAEVHVHKQTLGYRLRKVEQLTGRGFTRTQHLAEWWFALQAYDLLATCRSTLTRRIRAFLFHKASVAFWLA
jgi:PucR family transcriptional regulator, purine catabolism regulatory protein